MTSFLVVMGLIVFVGWVLLRPNRGKVMVCADCGHHGKTTTKTRGSTLIELVLWLCLIVPGVIYSIWRHTTRCLVCEACRSERVIPPNTPVGRKLISEQSAKP